MPRFMVHRWSEHRLRPRRSLSMGIQGIWNEEIPDGRTLLTTGGPAIPLMGATIEVAPTHGSQQSE